VLQWQFPQRGPVGAEIVELEIVEFRIGPARAALTIIGQSSAGPAQWLLHAGQYTAPAGQALTRFLIQPLVPTGSRGNLLDGFAVHRRRPCPDAAQ
jgi:hypothetical protein